jgi:hypothetical protein
VRSARIQRGSRGVYAASAVDVPFRQEIIDAARKLTARSDNLPRTNFLRPGHCAGGHSLGEVHLALDDLVMR